MELAQLMVSDPEAAKRIIGALPSPGAPGGAPGAPSPGGMPPGGAPGGIPHGMVPGAGAQPPPPMPPAGGPGAPGGHADPALMNRLAALEGQVGGMKQPLADYRLQQQMGEAGKHYAGLQKHFGEALPADFETMRPDVLQVYKDIVEGKVSPHMAAVELAALRKATAGDGTLRDRLVAAAAKNNPQPPPVEGRGGAVPGQPAPEAPAAGETAADRQRKLREGWDEFARSQAGA